MLSAAVLVGLVGCATQEPLPAERFYRLPIALSAPVAAVNPLQGTLAVERFYTDGLHNSRALVYSEIDQPLELHQYHYHHWVDAPTRLLQEHLIDYLRKTGAADRVMSYRPSGEPNYIVSGKIRRFEQVHTENGAQAHVTVDLELQLAASRSREILVLGDYNTEVAVQRGDMHAVIEGYATALDALYRRFLADIETTSSQRMR
jgi:ABC-type uncharacterized transport system auxiliary subunit